MRRARYRLGQFFTHLRPRSLTAAEKAEVAGMLGAGLAQLFRRQTVALWSKSGVRPRAERRGDKACHHRARRYITAL